MTELSAGPDNTQQILYIKLQTEDDEGEISYRGYRMDFLSQNLTEMEHHLILCPICKGVMRDACANQGDITCRLCSRDTMDHNSVNRIRELVGKLGIKCPLLRDCGWTGRLDEAEEHLLICESSLIGCPLGCESVIKRCEMNAHTNDECLLRKVECEFCAEVLTFGELEDHSETCPSQPIRCECGNEFQRCKQEVHIENECPLAEVECPYARYSCGIGKMFRRDLLEHKKAFYIEHQDLLQSRFEEESYDLREKLKSKKDLDGFEWKIFDFTNLSSDKSMEGPTFFIGGTEFVCVLNLEGSLTLKIMRQSITKERTEICLIESRLSIEKIENSQDPYFQTKISSKRIPMGKMSDVLFTLDKAVYSKYIQKDNCLTIKMYFDSFITKRKKEKDNQKGSDKVK